MNMQIKTMIYIIIFIVLHSIYVGCSSKTEPPQYTLIGDKDESLTMEVKGYPIEKGWEFSFPQIYEIQKVVINYDGFLNRVTFDIKENGNWKYLQTVDVQSQNSSVIELNAKTDSIRVFPQFSKKGNITSCKFYTAKKQNTFSIPLEKPPFIK